jgi:predicted transcriptional regulator
MRTPENASMSEEQRRPAQLSVRLEDDLRRVVEQRARAERRSVSNYLATVIAAAVGHDRGAAA